MDIYEIDNMIKDIQDSMKVENAEIKVKKFNHKIYYLTRNDAELFRQMGDKIYYQPELGYYIIRHSRNKDSYFF